MDFINWLITSSTDPRNTSLAVKGALVIGGGYLLHIATAACSLGLYCIGIDAHWINSAIEAITNIVFFGTSLIGPIITIVGLLRKTRLGQWSEAQ